MFDITVTHTPDCMKAFLYVTDSAGAGYPTEEQLFHALEQHGVVYGISAAALRAMHAGAVCNTYVEVAQGSPPGQGAPGKAEILVDLSGKGKPRKLADGRVDHRDISYVVNITKGTPLMRHIPPVPGAEGRTVFNKTIAPSQVSDVAFVAGQGSVISPQDTHILIADINGALTIHADGKIEVVDNKVVSGNVDYSTGNIRFSGNLRVTGTVRSGFEIDVDGDCIIGGNVEDAKITCRGDVEIFGGAIGASKGAIKCGGGVKVRHIANFTVQSGDDIRIAQEALHCILSAHGNIIAKSIVGGTVAAWKAIEAESIGSEAEPKTIVDLGGRFLLMQKKYHLLKELTALTGEVGVLKESMFILTRDEMDGTGKMSEGALKKLDAMKTDHRQRRDKCSQVQTDIESLDEILKHNPVSSIKAQTIYPNSILKFCTAEKTVQEKLNHARITVDGEKIVMGKY